MPDIESKAVWPGWNTVRLIGRGSFGEVYEIERDVFGDIEKCAMKHLSIPHNESEVHEMRAEGLDQESITRSFSEQAKGIVSEYKMMMRLNDCPNAVNCYDVECIQKPGKIGWDVYIRMELLTPLTDRLAEKGDWPEEEIIRLGRDICNALVSCGRYSIIHRDIKPQNIFVSGSGAYKLGDFGVARITEQTGSATARTGTYSYMAPEVYKGEHYGAQADIYSLGIVLYWLLNNRRAPFVTVNTAAEKDNALHRRMNGEKIPAPAHGSGELKQIVLKACAYDPKDRYASAEEMLRDLSAIDNTRINTTDEDIDDSTVYETDRCEPEQPGEESTASVRVDFTNRCSQCGAVIRPGNRFCSVCGTPANGSSDYGASVPTGAGTPKKKKSIWPGLAAVAGVLLIAAVIVIILGNRPKESNLAVAPIGNAVVSAAYEQNSSTAAVTEKKEDDLTNNSAVGIPTTETVETVKIYFYTNDLTDSDFTMRLSQSEDGDITLRAQAYPLSLENPTYKWSVDQKGIIELTPSADGSECKIHQIGVLQTGVVITVECNGVTCTVRCHAFE